jgi:hypothetical protein
MQMINVMKRLAELDIDNTNVEYSTMVPADPLATVTNMEIVKEGDSKLPQMADRDLADLRKLSGMKTLEECGMMGGSNTPASLNVTAGSGNELSSILKDLMGLAGLPGGSMGHDHGDEMPVMGNPGSSPDMDDKQVMRAMLDSMNDPAEETYDNTPADPTDIPPSQEGAREYNPNKGDHRERQAGLARAMPQESLETTLMNDLRAFMAEGREG